MGHLWIRAYRSPGVHESQTLCLFDISFSVKSDSQHQSAQEPSVVWLHPKLYEHLAFQSNYRVVYWAPRGALCVWITYTCAQPKEKLIWSTEAIYKHEMHIDRNTETYHEGV